VVTDDGQRWNVAPQFLEPVTTTMASAHDGSGNVVSIWSREKPAK
jgi:hypothetical protein